MIADEPATVARRWAEQLPREFARKLAHALREGPHAVRALRGEAVLPLCTAAVRTAERLAARGDGPVTAGLLAGRLDATAEQPSLSLYGRVRHRTSDTDD